MCIRDSHWDHQHGAQQIQWVEDTLEDWPDARHMPQDSSSAERDWEYACPASTLRPAADGALGGLLESDNDEEPEPFTGHYTWNAPLRVLRLEFLFEGDPPESFDVRFESRTQDGYVAVDDEGTAYVFMPAE